MLNNRHKVIGAFKTGIFPYIDGFQIKEESEEESEKKSEEELKEYINNTFTFIEENSEGINNHLFTKYFNFLKPSTLANKLYETKNKNKNNKLVEEIKNRWSNLKDEIKKMSEEEIENEGPNQILEIVIEIPGFNKEIQKQASGLKILTTNKIFCRLLISLAQLKAGNNSEKLKNEIRQLLYFLYRSKKLPK